MIQKPVVPEELASRKVPFGPLGKQVFQRTYSHKFEDGTKESWQQAIVRAVEGNLGLVSPRYIEDGEREKLLDLLMDFSVIPGGRHLYASGIQGRQYLSNCHVSGYITDEPTRHFTFLFDQLMMGGGVGANYSNRYIEKIPKVGSSIDLHIICDPSHPDIAEFDGMLSKHVSDRGDAEVYKVEDSREGWTAALGYMLRNVFSVIHEGLETVVVIDVSGIRRRGSPLVTSGGIACGPGPLVQMLTNVSKVINGAVGAFMTSLDVMLIDHALADCVVAGGKRRSSRMSVKNWKDDDIFEFVNCKQIDGTHWTTNISVEVDDEFFNKYRAGDKKAKDVARQVVLGMRANGEPGFWNRSRSQIGEKHAELVYCPNPCQPAWATVLTPDGIRTMGELKIGDTIWSGKQWTKVVNKQATGVKSVYAYRTRGGVFVGTKNHRVVSGGQKIEAQYAESIDTAQGSSGQVSVKTLNKQDIMDGLVLGDGMVHGASNDLVLLLVGSKDQSWLTSEVKDLFIKARPGITEEAYEIFTTLSSEELPKTYDRKIPARFLYGDAEKVCGFLRGLYSANGSVVANRVTLKASSIHVIDAVQSMLSSIGIASYYTINKPHTVEFSNGTYLCKQSYDLNISADRRLFCKWIGFIQPDKQKRLLDCCEQQLTGQRKSTYDITEEHYLGDEPVFDITVAAEEHTYWTGGLLVSNCGEIILYMWENCNLGSLNMGPFATRPLASMIEAGRLLTRWLIRATYGDTPHQCQRDVVDQNRRIGVGLMGFHEYIAMRGIKYSKSHDDASLRTTLFAMKSAVAAESAKYAAQLGIPEPVKHTCVAPTGTTAMLPGTTSGIQCMMSPWFKRLVRYSSDDPELAIKKSDGYQTFSDEDAKNTEIVVYWCEDPIVAKVRAAGWNPDDVLEGQSQIKFEDSLKVQTMFQECFADNAVSFTINLEPDSMPSEEAMESTLMEHLHRLKGTTVFPNKSRKNNPIQPVTKEEFDRYNGPKETYQVEDVCKGGACPIR